MALEAAICHRRTVTGTIFRVMGVALAMGPPFFAAPRAMHGNLHNKELTPAPTLFAGVRAGRPCCPVAMAMALRATARFASPPSRPRCRERFKLMLRKDLRRDYPRAALPHPLYAVRDMIMLLDEKRNLSREDAYTLCSLAADLRVKQTLNGSKGIHCMIAKTIVRG